MTIVFTISGITQTDKVPVVELQNTQKKNEQAF